MKCSRCNIVLRPVSVVFEWRESYPQITVALTVTVSATVSDMEAVLEVVGCTADSSARLS